MKLVLSTLLASLALPVLADVGSSASLTGLRYELVDLAPGDGIAPSIRYTGLSHADSFALWDFCFPSYCQRSQGSFTTPAFSSVQNDGTGQTSVFAAVSAAGLFTGGQWANGVGTGSGNGRYLGQARYQGARGGPPLFVVSAHIGVRITGQYTLDAWVNPTEILGPYHRDYGAGAGVFFHSRFLDGSEPLVEIGASSSERFAHETGELSVLLRNDKDHQATLWGKWGVWSSGQVPIGIPEPSTWALMLAGVGLVGGVVQRRRAHDAAR
ncbi:PEPxxWA-CTERM sorting domain-containing protein [Azohydromonas caseinilytica]|uniref:PEPxxWA-CTERM sorting domain-containing protein n=1 Tax=Azohydromonas caseinilytica TaxID=2728836 RepID=A0A848FIE2_9BURK|nr:PEPxxWA-CTERM sorting domain-containing protein [Azohydromonas caseinilytica]NML18916.1 PEPxxWA-CTERM sorting domain-containing protein [Azohydromonas caseinilytica]